MSSPPPTLVPCAACARHIDAASARCPFCGAATDMGGAAGAPGLERAEITLYGAPPIDPAELARMVPLYGGPPVRRSRRNLWLVLAGVLVAGGLGKVIYYFLHRFVL
jgi:hypothetical protein